MKINIYPENQYTELTLSVQIPFVNRAGSDFDIDKARVRRDAWVFDLVGAFSERMIASLERRVRACKKNLISHLDDIIYSDECGHIEYSRKDGSVGQFNVVSFKAMEDAIKALKQSCWKDFINNPVWIDQTIKALLNDPVQDHSDCGVLKYSNLVSYLCEIHMLFGAQ